MTAMDNHDNQDLIDMLNYHDRQLQMKNEMIELLKRQLKDNDKQICVLKENYLKLQASARGAPQPVAPGTNRVISGGSLLAPQHSGAVSLTPQPQQQSGLSSSSSSSTVRIESGATIDGMQHSSVSVANLIPPELPSMEFRQKEKNIVDARDPNEYVRVVANE